MDGQTGRQTDRQNYDSQDRASIDASRGKNWRSPDSSTVRNLNKHLTKTTTKENRLGRGTAVSEIHKFGIFLQWVHITPNTTDLFQGLAFDILY